MAGPVLLAAVILVLTGGIAGGADQAALTARHWPPGYFHHFQKLSVPEKKKLLARVDAALKQLKEEGGRLIAKGAVIEDPDPGVKTYQKLTILDDSGLTIVARNVPNLYYRYTGPGPINPNIYIVVRNARVNQAESFIRQSLVVEGEFQAYADKFVKAVMQGLENAQRYESSK